MGICYGVQQSQQGLNFYVPTLFLLFNKFIHIRYKQDIYVSCLSNLLNKKVRAPGRSSLSKDYNSKRKCTFQVRTSELKCVLSGSVCDRTPLVARILKF